MTGVPGVRVETEISGTAENEEYVAAESMGRRATPVMPTLASADVIHKNDNRWYFVEKTKVFGITIKKQKHYFHGNENQKSNYDQALGKASTVPNKSKRKSAKTKTKDEIWLKEKDTN